MRDTSPFFERAFERQERTEHHLPYISKSRLMQYIKNPYHFYLVYVRGLREPENFYMRRGSAVHAVFEAYYENIVRVYEETGGVYGDLMKYLPSHEEWATWLEPYISNFLLWEYRRLETAPTVREFVPVGIEAEAWEFYGDGSERVPLMGYADVVLWASSVPEVEHDEGVCVIDFKTGKSKNGLKYGDKPGGVLDELEYYAMLFEDEFEVSCMAIYYPRDDVVLAAEPDEKRRDTLLATIRELVNAGTDPDNYPPSEGPLCKWGPGEDQQSFFYGICPCKWGTQSGPGPTYCTDDKSPI
jgi:CRISPR/Cas system-associated exonuclease Cas4 (RecB family)